MVIMNNYNKLITQMDSIEEKMNKLIQENEKLKEELKQFEKFVAEYGEIEFITKFIDEVTERINNLK